MIEAQSNVCPNCNHENSSEFNYCESCGQKNRPLRITFYDFITDFMDVVFNLDNKFWKTLRVLFIPGKLTKIFFQGRRKSFYHPLRLYLVAVIFLFTALSILKLDNIIDLNVGGDLKGNFEKTVLLRQQGENIENTLDSLQSAYTSPRENQLLDSVRSNIFLINGEDSLSLEAVGKRDSTNLKMILNSQRFSDEELFIDDIEEVLDSKGIDNRIDRFAFKQFLKGARDLNSFNAFIFANLTWLFLAIIPVFSAILKLFYIRRDRFYMEHFVFLLHLFTAVIFLYGILILVLVPLDLNLYAGLASGIIAIFYPFLAFKYYYDQGWIKTLIKYVGLGFFFFMAFMITFLFFLLATAALF